MRPNAIFWFFGVAVSLLLARFGMLWTKGYEWIGPYLILGAVTAGVCGAAIWIYPILLKIPNVDRAHVQQLRHAQEMDLYSADPAIRAFIEQRQKDIANGVEPHDMQIGGLIMILLTQSEWGRWMAKQIHQPFPIPIPVPPSNRPLLRIAESHFLTQLEQGMLASRGFYNGDTNDIRFITPNWWGRVYIEIVEDPISIFRATIKPRDKVDPKVCARFTSISCELPKFLAMFPKAGDSPKA
jgi:hypothetical protein